MTVKSESPGGHISNGQALFSDVDLSSLVARAQLRFRLGNSIRKACRRQSTGVRRAIVPPDASRNIWHNPAHLIAAITPQPHAIWHLQFCAAVLQRDRVVAIKMTAPGTTRSCSHNDCSIVIAKERRELFRRRPCFIIDEHDHRAIPNRLSIRKLRRTENVGGPALLRRSANGTRRQKSGRETGTDETQTACSDAGSKPLRDSLRAFGITEQRLPIIGPLSRRFLAQLGGQVAPTVSYGVARPNQDAR